MKTVSVFVWSQAAARLIASWFTACSHSSPVDFKGLFCCASDILSNAPPLSSSLPVLLPPSSPLALQDHNMLVVSNLRPSTYYRLEVQVITTGGEGPATVKTFQTPDILPVTQHRE